MTSGSIFFSYAWDDNADGYVGDVFEAFVRRLKTRLRGDEGALTALGVQNAEDLVFFDRTNRAKMGVTADWLAERAERAQFLVLFVGDAYLRSDWCLFEWDEFQRRLGDEAKRRVLVVELVKNALQEEAARFEFEQCSEPDSRTIRLNRLKTLIRNEFFHPTGQRIDARMARHGEVSLTTDFIEKVYELADEILNRLLQCCERTHHKADVASSSQALATISEKIRDELRNAVKEKLRNQGIEIGDKVRAGEFSQVFSGYDTRVAGAKVAIKVLVRSSRLDAVCSQLGDAVKRATRHALLHESLINIRAFHWDSEPRYVVMDYIDWPSLKERLESSERRCLDPDTVATILANLAEAQAAALLRDLPLGPLYPSDIRVDDAWAVRISPFRIEAQVTSLLGLADGFPFRWEALGRLPPELHDGHRPTPATYDSTGQYYLGLLGLELLRGHQPVEARNLADLRRLRAFHRSPRRYFAGDAAPDCWSERSPALAFVIARLLERDPSKRYPSTSEAATELGKVAEGSLPPSAMREVRSSRGQVIDEQFARRFYSNLFAEGGERMRSLFGAGGQSKQHLAFVDALSGVDSYDPEGHPPLRTTFDRHAGRGITPGDVDLFRSVLGHEIDATLRAAPRQRDAWRVLLHRPFADLRSRLT